MLTFLQTGDWSPGDVAVEWVAPGRRVVPEVEAIIDRTWAEALARPGAHLFDGPMLRLERWTVAPDGRLRLALSPTRYKPFFGTNMSHPELADRYGPAVLANPVGVSAALETADGFLLLGRRNAAVAYYPERVHPFAGALEPADGDDVFAALVEDRALRQPELIFLARGTLTRRDVESNLDRAEHRGTFAVETSPAAV